VTLSTRAARRAAHLYTWTVARPMPPW